MLPKRGDVFFVQNNHIISKLMRWFMRSQWSHCGIVAGEFEGVTMVVETSDFEVVIAPLHRYLDGRKIEFYTISDNDGEIAVSIYAALKLIGTRYSWERLFSWAIRTRLFKWFPIFPKSNVICTDVPLVAWRKKLGVKPYEINTEELYGVVCSLIKAV
jgi:hypothetical protein